MDRASGEVIAGPNFVSRGFIYVRDSEELMKGAEERVQRVLDRCRASGIKEWSMIKNNIREDLGRYLYEKTRRRPMILPIIQDVQ